MGICLIWGVDLIANASAAQKCTSLLSKDELIRSTRFVQESDRTAFILCRAALRFLLARQFNCSETDLHFSTGTGGKPRLVDRQAAFSVAHTRGFGLIGIGSGGRIGVDVESISSFEGGDIAQFVMTPTELARWKEMGRSQALVELAQQWVLKEALLKALGVGLSMPMNEFWLARDGFCAVHGSDITLPLEQTVVLWQAPGLFISLVALDEYLNHKICGVLCANDTPAALPFRLCGNNILNGWEKRPIIAIQHERRSKTVPLN